VGPGGGLVRRWYGVQVTGAIVFSYCNAFSVNSARSLTCLLLCLRVLASALRLLRSHGFLLGVTKRLELEDSTFWKFLVSHLDRGVVEVVCKDVRKSYEREAN
jgi:hypothetical protein